MKVPEETSFRIGINMSICLAPLCPLKGGTYYNAYLLFLFLQGFVETSFRIRLQSCRSKLFEPLNGSVSCIDKTL